MIPHHSTNATRLIQYLTAGVTPAEAARALGITPGAVTQLMQQPEVSAELEKAREEQLQRSTAIDAKYDALEDKLLTQLERTVPLLLRPAEIANVLTRVNQAKRRGAGHTATAAPAKILQLNLPIAIQTKFVLNSSNQVITAGEQELVTIQSGSVPKLIEAQREAQNASTLQPPIKSQVLQEDEFGFTYERQG